MAKRKKVLIIPGGGTFGWIPIQFLETLGIDDITKYVDALGGTSIGGIESLYLGLKKSPAQLKIDFKEEVVKIFEKPSFFRRLNPYSSKYPAENIEPSLQKMLPGVFGDIKIPTIIQATNFKYNTPKVFDNITGADSSLPIWQIGRATSAAPTFFPAFSDNVWIDGGLTSNIPIFSTAFALKSKLGWDLSNMDVFVIGTGWKYQEPKTLSEVNSYGYVSWAKSLLINFCTTNANEVATDYWAKEAGFNSYTYFNPISIDEDMDDTSVVTTEKYVDKCNEWKDLFKNQWEQFMSGENKGIYRSLSRGNAIVKSKNPTAKSSAL